MGRIEWVSTDDHEYTGVFTGADTGIIRLSAADLVIRPEEKDDNPGRPGLIPSIAVKLLRDGIDSANMVANGQGLNDSYNFFAHDMVSDIRDLFLLYDEPALMRGRAAT